jgi:hypothetical protein
MSIDTGTPEIASHFGVMDSYAFYPGYSLSTLNLRTLSRMYNRLAAKAEPMFNVAYPVHELDTVFGTASVPFQTAANTQSVSISSWQLLTPPFQVMKKPGLSRMYFKIGYSLANAAASVTHSCKLQIVTSKSVFDESGTGANTITLSGASTSSELYDIPISSTEAETISIYVKGIPTNDRVYSGALGLLGYDNGSILGSGESEITPSNPPLVDPATGESFTSLGTYMRFLVTTTTDDIMPPRVIVGTSDTTTTLGERYHLYPAFDATERNVLQSVWSTLNMLYYTVNWLPRIRLKYLAATAMARTV